MKKIIFTILFQLLYCKEIIFPSIALVLSGGGAKGVAQIPTLKVIDSLNIPIDYVIGTSIGSISGGMYAIGYSPEEIEEIFFDTDWELLVADKKIRKKLNFFKKNNYQKYQLSFTLQELKPKVPIALNNGHESFIHLNKLTRYNESIYNFDDYITPFRCNAADILSGNEIIFKEGSLSKSLRCSSSIPSVFSPVIDNNMLLVDGGVLNNLGIDIAKNLGADIIIAVDVSSQIKKNEDIVDVFDVLSQTIQLNALNKKNKNKQLADILIEPKLSGDRTLNFSSTTTHEMHKIGYKEVYNHLESLVKIKNSLPQNKNNNTLKLTSIETDSINIKSIIINSISPVDVNELFDFNTPKKISKKELITQFLEIRKSAKYNNINFEFLKDNDDYQLIINLEKNKPITIDNVYIEGNHKISDSYIKRIIDMQIGDILDYTKLDNKITQLYNLDFFESISYELINLNNHHAEIKFNIKESEFKRLKLGGSWSSYYKMIAKLRLDLIYKPFDRFRFQNVIKIGNSLKENNLSLLYTGRYIKQLPIIPLIRYNYKKNELPYLSQSSVLNKEITTSKHEIFGFLIPLQNFGYIELNTNKQKIKYQNTEEILDFYSASFGIDQLDNILYPTQGFIFDYYYERSTEDLNYYYNNFTIDQYIKIFNRSSIRFYGDYLDAKNLNSTFKNIHYFKPDRTLAYSEYDVFSSDMLSYGVELNYLYKRSQTIRFLFNKIDRVNFSHNNEKFENFHSYGIGLRIKSILGPINLLWTRAEKGFFDNNKIENYYFSIGIDY